MKAKILGSTLVAILAASPAAFAAKTENWQFEITPYAWMTGMEGEATVNGKTVEFDKKFSDIVDKVDLAGSVLAEAQKGRMVFWLQTDYFALSTKEFVTGATPNGGKFESTIGIQELAVGTQVDGWMPEQTFEILVGARLTQLNNTLTLNGMGQFKKKISLTDPILLVRPSLPILPSKISGLRFNPTLGIGGGSDSKYIYELQPQVQYQFNDRVALRVGYRRVGYKFEDKNNVENQMNMRLAGLLVGLGMTW